jgi:demethylmenaquinone methyltransferase/2-methoxy-6-polyprenyl-1,4-benzoquinol methylase
MRRPADKERAKAISRMFGHIAQSYDQANHWMTWGQDRKWRREVIQRAHLSTGGRLLDIGTGTGDLALESIHRYDPIIVIGLDFTQEMMQIGRSRELGNKVNWLNSDALDLPFNSGSFDAVVSGYLLRNVNDVKKALDEQYRVLRMGGTMISLDTTPPPNDLRHLPVWFYLRWIIPIIGGFITGDVEAYRYLPESTHHFLSAPDLAECLREVGFKEIGFRCFMGGCMAIHWAVK